MSKSLTHFQNRAEAGIKLAEKLQKYKGADTVILGLPRGGVVVAAEIAKALDAPLDITSPRKIGHPSNPEYAIGAITETGDGIWNEKERAACPELWLRKEVEKEKKEAQRRLRLYRGGRPEIPLLGKTVILVDDGIATGLTMRAAIAGIRGREPQKLVVAVPVTANDSAKFIRREADELIALYEPLFFGAVGAFYDDFPQVEDKEVIKIIGSL